MYVQFNILTFLYTYINCGWGQRPTFWINNMNQKEPSTVCVPLHQTHQTSSTNKPFVFFFKCCFLWATFQCPSVALCDHCCTLVVFDCLLKMKWRDNWVSLQSRKVDRRRLEVVPGPIATVHGTPCDVCLISLQRKEKRNCRREPCWIFHCPRVFDSDTTLFCRRPLIRLGWENVLWAVRSDPVVCCDLCRAMLSTMIVGHDPVRRNALVWPTASNENEIDLGTGLNRRLPKVWRIDQTNTSWVNLTERQYVCWPFAWWNWIHGVNPKSAKKRTCLFFSKRILIVFVSFSSEGFATLRCAGWFWHCFVWVRTTHRVGACELR